MLKTLKAFKKQEKEAFSVPASVQKTIPIKKIYPDGIFQVGIKFSKSYKFADINYLVASEEDQVEMLKAYCNFLNSLDVGVTTKITINNRRINRTEFEKSVLYREQNDTLDEYRAELNRRLVNDAVMANNNIKQEKYITVSVVKKDIEEARIYFNRVENSMQTHLKKMSSGLESLDATERLRIFHDFYRIGEEVFYHFDLKETMKKGHNFKDYISPDSFEFPDNNKNHFIMGNKYGRVLWLREYASYIKDTMITELCELNRNLMLSIDIIPVPTDEAVKEVQRILLGIETKIANHRRKSMKNDNFTGEIPYELEQERIETKEYLDALTNRDQRMMLNMLTLVHTADTKEQLDSDTESLLSIARSKQCQFAVLNFQQLEALNTVLPFGVVQLKQDPRTLNTESTAILIPFKTQEMFEKGGTYYGLNAVSKNLIVINRRTFQNGNGWILGVPGSGKSLFAKYDIADKILASGDDVLCIDPEREYLPLAKRFGGEVIRVSPDSKTYINAMDINQYYGDDDPIRFKADFILSLCEQAIHPDKINAKEHSLIDRCVGNIYRAYMSRGFDTKPPTLLNLHAELMRQEEQEAKDIALKLELFTKGSLNTFAKQTNVDVNNRFIVYDIKDLGTQLKTIGMLVVLDAIFNRITRNRTEGRTTWIIIDEIYLLFANDFSSNFLFELWKRVRKYGACCTGITQNIGDLLQSHNARTMLGNSEFLVMLNQAPNDRLDLANLLNISPTQLSYITNSEAGHGLIKCAGSIVPFINKFPTDSQLYKLMTTKPSEQNDWQQIG